MGLIKKVIEENLLEVGTSINVNHFTKEQKIDVTGISSGKGFAGLIGLIKNKKFTKNDNVLFIHTGGAVSLSAYEWAFNK